MESSLVFIDAETSADTGKILDLGAVREDGTWFHSGHLGDFLAFIEGSEYVCGHNILRHDLVHIERAAGRKLAAHAVDTLTLSPLLFPKRPYHALLKDDKLQVDELNNPVNDCIKAQRLFHDEVNAFLALPEERRSVYEILLRARPDFEGFFSYLGLAQDAPDPAECEALVQRVFACLICAHADLSSMIRDNPEALAYALALIGTDDPCSVMPPWILRTFPVIGNLVRLLRHTPCQEGCPYCREALDVRKGLKRIFGFDQFRSYNGEPLQEKAAQAAVDGKSLLAIFPTGGGKSITFQLPALMAGETMHGLTVVISPLLSLMKDQVDNLLQSGITDAVTVNGLVDPIERANALERVVDGSASMVYVSPEFLRSRTLERLLVGRHIARFVIDEAHCFSAWGQDFRVDYQYIGHFIKDLQEKKGLSTPIPVSCFTATAKQKVISDIRDYFADTLKLDLALFASSATRENLHYTVLFKETDREKYDALRSLLELKKCPTIVYVSRTRQTVDIAGRLTEDGFPARAFHGKLSREEKIASQEAFMSNEVRIIVATSAFGMGVDKKDVGLVVHHDISSSLEDYVQEAGRAGRDPGLQADCYVLYNDSDLDKHFFLLNRTKLSMSEIQQVWSAIKELSKQRPCVRRSALEIARVAGWKEDVPDVETRVKTAVAALEHAKYVRRGKNVPHVYATSILARSMMDAEPRIDRMTAATQKQRENAKRIMSSLISSRSVAKAGNDDAESRVDYLADRLGLEKEDVIEAINLMRQEGLLANELDMSAYIQAQGGRNRSMDTLQNLEKLDRFLLGKLRQEGTELNLKKLNQEALDAGLAKASVRKLRTLVNFLAIRRWVRKFENRAVDTVALVPELELPELMAKNEKRRRLCHFIVERLYDEAKSAPADESKADGPQADGAKDLKAVQFSVLGLLDAYKKGRLDDAGTQIKDVEDALLYLSTTGILQLEGGFLVLYNAMEINRLVLDNRKRYKKEDYRILDEHYRQKIQQIHIVGQYANLVVRDYEAALRFVHDYFQMDYKLFIARYFKGERAEEIDRNISAKKFNDLFGKLSDVQRRIIDDHESRCIAVAAGPGSGKTRVLVHKLASLLLMEDVKSEQLLMLTFSRAAATEFQKRLAGLIGSPAFYVDIRTFHSYSFEVLGLMGSVEGAEGVVSRAVDMIRQREVEPSKASKTVLVVDEAQDMARDEYELVRALMERNEGMRVIAVGDDDQNIFAFRGSDSGYLRKLGESEGAACFEMTENYRSGPTIVAFANAFAQTIGNRMKRAPIVSMRKDADSVSVTRYFCTHMEEGVVRQVVRDAGRGSCCVLTQTNEEALRVASLLLQKGVCARLIQCLDSFRLWDLVEVRYFLKQLDSRLQSPVIPDEVWETAKKRLFETYERSTCLSSCKRLLEDFETSRKEKRRTDLEEFIRESSYDDFHEDDREAVTVSTIHKAKGREFDVVHMMLKGWCCKTDDDRRTLYVGMTRAKNGLHIHCSTGLFSGFHVPGVVHKEDRQVYPEPTTIELQLSHRDVVLDFFKSRKMDIFQLRCGDRLSFHDPFEEPWLTAEIGGKILRVARLSKACLDRLQELARKGYRLHAARVRFIVAWKGKEDTEETAVILPDLVLRRESAMPDGADRSLRSKSA